MKCTWTIIGVRDVPRSFKWYQSLFGQKPTRPGHSYFGQLVDTDGTVLLCLHEWGVEDHPHVTISALSAVARKPAGKRRPGKRSPATKARVRPMTSRS